MSNAEDRKSLNESIEFFEDFINKVLPMNVEGIRPMDIMKHYNILRTELSKLYVD